MQYLKQLKSREMIETGLKTIATVIIGIILIILMEGMIYGIYMNKIKENTATQYVASECVAYCEEVKDGEYRIYLHNTESGSWHIKVYNESVSQINNSGYEKVVYRTPNAFDVSIKPSHYIVMSVFIVGLLGYFGWKFYRLNVGYNKLETKYQKLSKSVA